MCMLHSLLLFVRLIVIAGFPGLGLHGWHGKDAIKLYKGICVPTQVLGKLLTE
jgi:hypothetical protein